MSDDPGAPLLTQRLNHLFETVPNPATGRPYTNAEASRTIEAAAEPEGPTVSPSAISQLRQGTKTNPTATTLAALARLFGVTPNYFFDVDEAESARADAALELLRTAEDSNVRNLAFRANGLSTESLEMIKTVIERARKLEGLEGRPDSE